MSDDELIEKIVKEQIDCIFSLRLFENNPLWLSYPSSYQQIANQEWQEAINKNLHHTINNKVKEYFDNLL